MKRGGVQYEDVVKREMVFVDRKSTGMQEYYLATQSGFKLEMQLECRMEDYANQEYIEYNNDRFKIIRTFDKGDTIELKCEKYNGKGQA